MVKVIHDGTKPKPPWQIKWVCPDCNRVVELEEGDRDSITTSPGQYVEGREGFFYSTSNNGRIKHLVTWCPTCGDKKNYRRFRSQHESFDNKDWTADSLENS